MLPKQCRLADKKDFERVHRFGKFFGQDFLAVKIVKNNLDVSRFGFVIGLKISKKAVERNKVKRRLRESVRLKLAKIKKGFDVTVFVRPVIVEKNYKEIDEMVGKVLGKAGLLENSKSQTPNYKQYPNSNI